MYYQSVCFHAVRSIAIRSAKEFDGWSSGRSWHYGRETVGGNTCLPGILWRDVVFLRRQSGDGIMRKYVAQLEFVLPSNSLSQEFAQKITGFSTCTIRSTDDAPLDIQLPQIGRGIMNSAAMTSPLVIDFAGTESDLNRLFALVAFYNGQLTTVTDGFRTTNRELWRLAQQAGIAQKPTKSFFALSPLEIFTGGCHRLLDSRIGRFLDYRVLFLLALILFYEGGHRMTLAFVRLDESAYTIVTSRTGRGNRTRSIDHKEVNRRRDEHQTQNTILLISFWAMGGLMLGLGICDWSRQ